MKKVVLFISLILVINSIQGAVIHIPGDQPTIQQGIDIAINGDTVLIADGTYSGDGNRNIDFNGKAITVTSENGPNYSVINCSSEGRGFHFHSNETDSSILSGVKITGGATFVGSGILCEYASPIIENCIISNNVQHGYFDCLGGGIASIGNSEPQILNCTITDNRLEPNAYHVGFGGGIYCSESSPFISNCFISSNQFSGFSGALGGGIYATNSNLTVIDTTISFNSSTEEYSRGGGIHIDGASSPSIVNCVISNNNADFGGGISYANLSVGEIAHCHIDQNNVAQKGAGLYFETSAPEVINCLITRNTINTGSGAGGAFNNSFPTLTNCTFTENIVYNGNGGGISCEGSNLPSIVNCIFWGDHPNEIDSTNAVDITYSDIENGYSGTGNISENPLFVRGPLGNYYLSNISAGQPNQSLCIDAGSGSAQNICYHPPSAETCLNELTTRTDIVSDTGVVDLGYHYFPIIPPTPTPTPTFTPTKTPTFTSTPVNPTNTPTQQTSTSTPTPVYTPTCGNDFGSKVYMPYHHYQVNSPCYCRVKICNPTSATYKLPVFVLLEAYGIYFFAPSFNTGFDYYGNSGGHTIPPGESILIVLPQFNWPSGTGSGVATWYSAITNPEITGLLGDVSSWAFGWGP
ncbi:right-handed parallel beta-helix repeat-containing protein [bacterium]|nr:right-handed parallel beta-helix repeat-containing protein [candidate division CSSED10-310 bacterium]